MACSSLASQPPLMQNETSCKPSWCQFAAFNSITRSLILDCVRGGWLARLGLQSVGMANKKNKQYLCHSWALLDDLKYSEASFFLPILSFVVPMNCSDAQM